MDVKKQDFNVSFKKSSSKGMCFSFWFSRNLHFFERHAFLSLTPFYILQKCEALTSVVAAVSLLPHRGTHVATRCIGMAFRVLLSVLVLVPMLVLVGFGFEFQLGWVWPSLDLAPRCLGIRNSTLVWIKTLTLILGRRGRGTQWGS